MDKENFIKLLELNFFEKCYDTMYKKVRKNIYVREENGVWIVSKDITGKKELCRGTEQKVNDYLFRKGELIFI